MIRPSDYGRLPQPTPTRRSAAAEFGSSLGDILEETHAVLTRADREEGVTLLYELHSAHRIFVVGAGRSKLAVDAFAMRLMHLGYDAHVHTEMTSPAAGHGDLVVACSGSGETRTVVNLLRTAKEAGARTIAVTASTDSTLARSVDLVVALPERSAAGVQEASAQFVGSLFEQTAFLYLDAIVLTIERLEPSDRNRMLARHNNLE